MTSNNSFHRRNWLRYYALPARQKDNLHEFDATAFQGVFDDLPEGHTIVDVGCGNGRMVSVLPYIGVSGYLGVDMSDAQIALASEKHPGHRFEVCDIADLGAKYPEAFDGFYCGSMLMCVPRTEAEDALASLANCLKPGAVGMLTTGIGPGYAASHEGAMAYFYEPEELLSLVCASGFKVRDYRLVADIAMIIWAEKAV